MKNLLSLLVAGGDFPLKKAEIYLKEVESGAFDANEDPIAGVIIKAFKEADPDYIGYAISELQKVKTLIDADGHHREIALMAQTDTYKTVTPQDLIDLNANRTYIITTPKFHGSSFRSPGGRDDNWNKMYDNLDDK